MGKPVADISEATADGETIMAEIIGDEATGRVLVITAERESAKSHCSPRVTYQPRSLQAKAGAKSARRVRPAPIGKQG